VVFIDFLDFIGKLFELLELVLVVFQSRSVLVEFSEFLVHLLLPEPRELIEALLELDDIVSSSLDRTSQ
jgi:hypothetical protein